MSRLSRSVVVLAACGAVAALPRSASALNPPNAAQDIYRFFATFDNNTPNDPTDDMETGFSSIPTGDLASPSSCGAFVQPPGQPKAPDACGTSTLEIALSPGYWLYYDGDAADAPSGGWNASNQWWRNRLILRYENGDLLLLGRYRPNPAHPDCPTTDPCPTGVKFCGPLVASWEGAVWSEGSFEACMQPE